MIAKQDIDKIEADVLADIGPIDFPGNYYFKEPVARVLWESWLKDPKDLRLAIYCSPMIEALIIRHRNLLSHENLREVYNVCFLDLLDSLKNYKPISKKGKPVKLFTFCTATIKFRILDYNAPARLKKKRIEQGKRVIEHIPLESAPDQPTQMDEVIRFNDFLSYLEGLKPEYGATANKIITGLVEIITKEPNLAICGQDRIINRLCEVTNLPLALVQPYYRNLLELYKEGF